MANIDLVPRFWEEFKESGQVVSSKRAMVERFARWLDEQGKERKPRTYTKPVQSIITIHRQVDDN